LLEVVRRLDDRGVETLDLALERPSLDEVFLSVTGHAPTRPTDPDPDTEAAQAAGSQQ